jgi:hypothetical protein
MIDEKTRRELIDAGWKPPVVTDYEPWRPALAAYWEQRGFPGAATRILDGCILDSSDKETINGMAAARSVMPPE